MSAGSESPEQFRLMVSLASFHLREGPNRMGEEEVQALLQERFPGAPAAERFAAYVMGSQSAEAFAAFPEAPEGQTLAQMSGLEPGTRARLSFRARIGSTWIPLANVPATASTTVQQARELALAAYEGILDRNESGRYEEGWTVDDIEELDLFAVLPE